MPRTRSWKMMERNDLKGSRADLQGSRALLPSGSACVSDEKEGGLMEKNLLQ
ncbi:unnamed protein product, partial [Amoebophrya sp. A25]|eukprot:GSA25T00007307001.1